MTLPRMSLPVAKDQSRQANSHKMRTSVKIRIALDEWRKQEMDLRRSGLHSCGVERPQIAAEEKDCTKPLKR